MATAICPGSFDPPTNGHVDVIQRACRHFDRVVVAVAVNPDKIPLLSADKRVELLREVLGHLDNVEVESYEGLLVNLARERGAGVIVKGLRALSDVERELQMAQMNSGLYGAVDTFFVTTDPRWSFVSSSLVKEVAAYGGDVSGLVPPAVNRLLKGR
ncbi:MAG TPA: pantetheine-phosphate adenylyltransferase [Actinomycetota bacterium]|nr:pantetheine-phosphate adenylyltransferase [Actinomycetota bacterium]